MRCGSGMSWDAGTGGTPNSPSLFAEILHLLRSATGCALSPCQGCFSNGMTASIKKWTRPCRREPRVPYALCPRIREGLSRTCGTHKGCSQHDPHCYADDRVESLCAGGAANWVCRVEHTASSCMRKKPTSQQNRGGVTHSSYVIILL